MTRKERFEAKRNELMKYCDKCRSASATNPSFERCDYYCSIGRKLRMLEVEYSDVTGWTHDRWQKN